MSDGLSPSKPDDDLFSMSAWTSSKIWLSDPFEVVTNLESSLHVTVSDLAEGSQIVLLKTVGDYLIEEITFGLADASGHCVFHLDPPDFRKGTSRWFRASVLATNPKPSLVWFQRRPAISFTLKESSS